MTILNKSILLFLAGAVVSNNIQATEKSKLDVYSAQIVGKYISNQDRLKLAQTNKKFRFLLDRERINREPITSNDDAKYIPFMQTQQLFAADDHIATDDDGNIIADILKIRYNISIQQLYSLLTNTYIQTENGIDYDDLIDRNSDMLRGLVIARNGVLTFDSSDNNYNIANLIDVVLKREYSSSKRQEYEFRRNYSFDWTYNYGNAFSNVHCNDFEKKVSNVLFSQISSTCTIDITDLSDDGVLVINKLKFFVDEVSPFAEIDYDTLVNQINHIKTGTINKNNSYITLHGFSDEDQAINVKTLILRNDISFLNLRSRLPNLELAVLNDNLLDITEGSFDGCSNQCTFVIPNHWNTIVANLDGDKYLHIHVTINNKLIRLCSVPQEDSNIKIYRKKHINIVNNKLIVAHDAENLVKTSQNINLTNSDKINTNGCKLYNITIPYWIDDISNSFRNISIVDKPDGFMNGMINEVEFNNMYTLSRFSIPQCVNHVIIPDSVQHIEPSAFINIIEENINITLPSHINVYAYNVKMNSTYSYYYSNTTDGVLIFAHNLKDNSYVEVGIIDNECCKHQCSSINGVKVNSIERLDSIVIPNGVRSLHFHNFYSKYSEVNKVITIPESLESISGKIPEFINTISIPDNCQVYIKKTKKPFYVSHYRYEKDKFNAPSIVYLEPNIELPSNAWNLGIDDNSNMFDIYITWANGNTLKIQDQGFKANKFQPFKIKKGDSIFEITPDMLGKTF